MFDFYTEDFPSHYGLSETWHSLDCSWEDIFRAAISVGRKDWKWVTKHGSLSLNELSFRVNMIQAFLVEDSTNHISRSSAFLELDPSEKTAISYFFGLVGAKLLAEKKFDVPWLMHLDVYTKYASEVDMLKVKKWREDRETRPDLLGLDRRRDWVVIEAKGRSNFVREALEKAKTQTENLKTINGQYPALRFGMTTYFSKNRWRSHLLDPKKITQGAPNLDISPYQFIKDYYAPVYSILNGALNNIDESTRTRKISFNNGDYFITPLASTNLVVGMSTIVYNYITETIKGDDSNFENILLYTQVAKGLGVDPPFKENPSDGKETNDTKIDNGFKLESDKNQSIIKDEFYSVGYDGIIVGFLTGSIMEKEGT